MTRVDVVARHPRLFVALWFGAFVAVLQTGFGLMFRALLTLGSIHEQSRPLLAQAIQPLAAACAGAWLGARLLEPATTSGECASRGAWIGIVTGLTVALAWSALPQPGAAPNGWPARFWPTVLIGILSALYQAGRTLPVGALTGWCLFRANAFRRRTGSEGGAS